MKLATVLLMVWTLIAAPTAANWAAVEPSPKNWSPGTSSESIWQRDTTRSKAELLALREPFGNALPVLWEKPDTAVINRISIAPTSAEFLTPNNPGVTDTIPDDEVGNFIVIGDAQGRRFAVLDEVQNDRERSMLQSITKLITVRLPGDIFEDRYTAGVTLQCGFADLTDPGFYSDWILEVDHRGKSGGGVVAISEIFADESSNLLYIAQHGVPDAPNWTHTEILLNQSLRVPIPLIDFDKVTDYSRLFLAISLGTSNVEITEVGIEVSRIALSVRRGTPIPFFSLLTPADVPWFKAAQATENFAKLISPVPVFLPLPVAGGDWARATVSRVTVPWIPAAGIPASAWTKN